MSTSEKKKQEDISLTTKETEKRASDVLDDDSLIEDDGDFFWVLQRVIWGILKGIFTLAIIIFLIWFIWGDFGTTSPLNKTSEKVSKVIKHKNIATVEPTNQVPVVYEGGQKLSSSSDIQSMITRSYRLANAEIRSNSGILSESVLWLKKAKSIGEISPTILRIQSPTVRAKKIEEILVTADSILKESTDLKKVLRAQSLQILQKKKILEYEIKALDDKIFEKIRRFSPNDIDLLLNEKIKKKKLLIEYSEQGKIRETLFKNIVNFETLLKQKWIPLIRPTHVKPPKTP